MALIAQDGGCKVGWSTYDSKEEAEAAAVQARADAQRRAARGYDFGYCVPGTIEHVPCSEKHGGIPVWIVTTP